MTMARSGSLVRRQEKISPASRRSAQPYNSTLTRTAKLIHLNGLTVPAMEFWLTSLKFQSGFDKLADFDKDGNHRLDGDEISRLRLWVDDGNGQLDSGELHKLSDHNIFSLSVRATENSGLSQSWAFTEDDSQLIIEDVWFVVTDASVSEDEQSDEPPVAMNHPLRWTMLP
jgi:hypothetical protein